MIYYTRFFLVLILSSISFFSKAQNEPAEQPSDLTFSTVRAYNFTMGFQPSQASGFLVLKSLQPVNFVPQDGVEYQMGQGVGNAKVISASNTTSFIVKEVVENTVYHFAVFAYNGSGVNINYKQDNPLTDTITSAKAEIGNYYNGINHNAPNFAAQLTQLINNHTLVAYNQYGNLVVPAFFERDTINGEKTVTCEYSDQIVVYAPPFGFQATGFSREHLMPRSWMPTGGDFATAEGADYHNLALTNLNNANNLRSNYAYGNIVTPTTTFLNCRLGRDANNIIVFEPTANFKGDAARAIFYQILCYNGTGGSNWGFFNLTNTRALEQNVNTLIQWHFNDMPDGFERAKHEYIYTLQNNRNPFIDYPELVDCIDFNQILKNAQCNSTVSVNEVINQNLQVEVYPNPVENLLYIHFDNTFSMLKSVSVYDMLGKEVRRFQPSGYYAVFTENIVDLQPGNYIVNIEFDNGMQTAKRIVKQ